MYFVAQKERAGTCILECQNPGSNPVFGSSVDFIEKVINHTVQHIRSEHALKPPAKNIILWIHTLFCEIMWSYYLAVKPCTALTFSAAPRHSVTGTHQWVHRQYQQYLWHEQSWHPLWSSSDITDERLSVFVTAKNTEAPTYTTQIL